MAWVVAAAAILLAFVNGANDNTKGVATLYGSGALGYRAARRLATLSTALGSLASVVLAGSLAKAFSTRGLVPDTVLTPEYLAAVALGASATVLIATRFGFPVSTTHALVGSLAGAGAVAAGSQLDLSALRAVFVAPLAAGPLLGLVLALGLVHLGARLGRWTGVGPATCVCVERAYAVPVAGGALALADSRVAVVVEHRDECEQRRDARVLGFEVRQVLHLSHVASAGLVGFARGLNDTPKILGLVAGLGIVSPGAGTAAIGGAMALGGWVAARRVAETLAQKLTPMTPSEGLAGNAATSVLVVSASYLGLPVSTTHVSTGGIFGIGASSGDLRWRMAGEVMLAWVVTLPLAAALGSVWMWSLR